jgi:hypothetical protein
MGVGGQRQASISIPGKDTRCTFYRRPGGENLFRTGIQSWDRPARSESLYWLGYPGPRKKPCLQQNTSVLWLYSVWQTLRIYQSSTQIPCGVGALTLQYRVLHSVDNFPLIIKNDTCENGRHWTLPSPLPTHLPSTTTYFHIVYSV